MAVIYFAPRGDRGQRRGLKPPELSLFFYLAFRMGSSNTDFFHGQLHRFSLLQTNICRKLPVIISIIFSRLPSIRQNFYKSRHRKLLGMQWHKKVSTRARTKMQKSFESHRFSSEMKHFLAVLRCFAKIFK